MVGGALDAVRVARVEGGHARRSRCAIGLDLLEEDVHRELEVDRAEGARERVPERQRDVLREPLAVRAHARPLGDRPHQGQLVELLERSALRLHQRARAADDEEGHLGRERARDGGHGSRDAGARGDDGDPARPAHAPPRLGGVRRRLLVAHVDDTNALQPAALVDRHHVAAGEREHDVHALGRDRLRDESASLHALGHRPERTTGRLRCRGPPGWGAGRAH